MTSIDNSNLWKTTNQGSTANAGTTGVNGTTSEETTAIDILAVLSDFQNGKISIAELKESLAKAGIDYTETSTGIEFVYNDKNYQIIVNTQTPTGDETTTDSSSTEEFYTYTILTSDTESSSVQTYTPGELQGFNNKIITDFFDKATVNGNTVYTLKEGKTYLQFLAALAENLEANPDVSINTSNLPGYSSGKTSSLELSKLLATTNSLADTAKTKALEYLDKNVKSELQTSFLSKYKPILLKLGYTENEILEQFNKMYESSKSTVGDKVGNLSNEIVSSGYKYFIKAWVSVDPKKLVDSFMKDFNKQIKTFSTEVSNKADSDVKVESEAEAEAAAKAEEAARAEKERRTNLANSLVSEYKAQLQQYNGAAQKLDEAVKEDIAKYLNNEIDDNTFKNNVKAKFEEIKAECINTYGGTVTNTDGSRIVTTVNSDKTKLVENYDKNGKLTSKTLYDASGKVYENCIYTYDSSGKVSKKVTTRYNSDGSYSIFTYDASTGAVTRKDYNKNGKDITVSGYSQINKGEIVVDVPIIDKNIDKTTQEMYNYITKDFDNTFVQKWFIKVSTRTAMTVVTGELTVALLEAAQIGQGKPAGATKEYGSIAETGYEKFITDFINNTVKKNFGYDPEDVKGYFFNSSSALAKAMAADSDMAKFVKNNIKDLINGTNLPKSMTFNSDDDLHNAIASCSILDSKLSGTTLTLTVFDLYDFDPSYISKLNDNSGMGVIVNAAGAAAMQDGKLKPYYHITEVKIDLTTIFTNDELRSLGII